MKGGDDEAGFYTGNRDSASYKARHLWSFKCRWYERFLTPDKLPSAIPPGPHIREAVGATDIRSLVVAFLD